MCFCILSFTIKLSCLNTLGQSNWFFIFVHCKNDAYKRLSYISQCKQEPIIFSKLGMSIQLNYSNKANAMARASLNQALSTICIWKSKPLNETSIFIKGYNLVQVERWSIRWFCFQHGLLLWPLHLLHNQTTIHDCSTKTRNETNF